MKVLFLDIDGVINTYKTCQIADMDGNKIDLLIDIIDQTGCKIVVSSDWRRGGLGQDSDYQLYLKRYNDNADKVIDATIGGTTTADMVRWRQIQYWLDTNDPVDSFAILEDAHNMGIYSGFTVFCDSNIGLTRDLADDVISLLNG